MKFYNITPDVNKWQLDTGSKIFDLNTLLNEEVYEVEWLDEDKKLVLANYTSFSGWEVMALINKFGQICFKSIYSIEMYDEDAEKILIKVQSDALNEDLFAYHGLEHDEQYYIIIDLDGKILSNFSKNRLEL